MNIPLCIYSKIKAIMSNKDNRETHTPQDTLPEQEPLKPEDMPENETGQDAAAATEPTAADPAQDAHQQLKVEHDELKDKYLRLLAEFDNYKRRAMRERLELMKTAAQDTLSALLPVLDDFDRAQKAAHEQGKDDAFGQGVGLIQKKLFNILQQRGLAAMETNGQPFDPEQHEAVTEIPAPAPELQGCVVDTVEKGYMLNDKIIRHPKVVVGK
jgi:molecular chaperone GrpE